MIRRCPRGHLIEGPRCQPCERARDRERGTRHARGYGNEWDRIRRRVLERDGYTCRLMRPGCRGEARSVDHVVPKWYGGRDDETNLVAACVSCNSGKRERVTV